MLSNAFLPFSTSASSSSLSGKSSPSKPNSVTPSSATLALPNASLSVPTTTMLAISTEYSALANASHCPTGMYVNPSQESVLLWTGVLFVHQGYYASSILRFQLTFPSNYPEKPPVVHFTTDVFHPLISQKDGLFSLRKRFTPWRPKDDHVFDILHWMKQSFKKNALDQLTEKDCLNKDAFNLYRDSTSSFAALAVQTSSLSQSPSALFDRDHPHMGSKVSNAGIVFRQLTVSEMDGMRKKVGVRRWIVDGD